MAMVSGNNGKVDMGGGNIADTLSFEVTRARDLHSRTTSSSAPWETNTPGNRRWRLTFGMAADDGSQNPGFEEGEDCAFIGTTNTGKTITGTVTVEDIKVGANIVGGEPVDITVTAIGKGAYTLVG